MAEYDKLLIETKSFQCYASAFRVCDFHSGNDPAIQQGQTVHKQCQREKERVS